MLKIYYSLNKVLFQHLEKINIINDIGSFGNIRVNNLDYFLRIFKIKIHHKKNLFVYNTSPANLLTSILSKLNGSKIIFHLHDPKPHSGFLNPFIYIIQFFQLHFSDHIIVFHPLLIEDTVRYYPHVSKNKIKVFIHGVPVFKQVKIDLSIKKINFGFFGRNMPYKNVQEFLNLSVKYPNCSFYIIGKGYDKISDPKQNLFIINRFVENDEYYSFMSKIDYIVLPYKDISFSGIINDAISMKKKMIVSEYVMNKYPNSLMILMSKFKNPKKQDYFNNYDGGWENYSRNLNKLIQ